MINTGKTILVTGSTGQQGRPTVEHLLKTGWRVRALTRHPEKPAAQQLAQAGAEIIPGDLNDAASLERAIEGVYGVYSVLTPQEHGPEVERQQGKLIGDLARQANVQHVVYSSAGGADRQSPLPHIQSKWLIEQYLRQLQLPLTVLYPVFFMDNLNWNRAEVLNGTFSIALHPATRLQMISAQDIGLIAAAAFNHPGDYIGQAIEIAGDELTMPEAAAAFSKVIGRKVEFVEQPIEAVESFAPELAATFRYFNQYTNQANIPELRRQHPTLMTFEQWLRFAGWQSA